MLDRAQWINLTGTYRNTLKLGSAAAALGTALVFGSSAAEAQQVVPGVDPECPIVTIDGQQVAVCEGDLEDGITASPATPDFDRIVVRNPDAPIAPPGYFGIGLVKDNGDLDILIEDGVIIDVFDDPGIPGAAQGIISVAQNGFNLQLETGADITADGNGSVAFGIEAIAQGGGEAFVTNAGDIDAFTSGDSAIAIQARGSFASVANGEVFGFPAGGGNISVRSDGTGERSTVTAGILAISDGFGFRIQNFEATVTVETGAASFDTDFNGIAGALVGNAFNSVGGSVIFNSGDLLATGPQTHGIVGFVESIDAANPARLSINNGTTVADETIISTNGVGSYGILAQGRGPRVDLFVLTNSRIDITSGAGEGYGIFALQEAQQGEMDIRNEGTITGQGDFLSGILVSTLAGASDGDYTLDITNSGDITLDGGALTGIGVATEAEDDITATITNSGNIDLSASTNPLSVGIGVAVGTLDANITGDGDSAVTITNSGDITMGAGTAIFAVADEVDLFDNAGALLTLSDQSDIVRLGGAGGPTQISATFDQTILGSVGDDSNGIVIEPLADNSNLFLVLDTVVLTTAGTESHGVLVEQLGENSAAEFTIANSVIAAPGPSSDAINIAAIGQGSALTFNMSNTAAAGSDNGNGHALLIGGIAGPNSAINVNLLNAVLSTRGDTGTVFEIERFVQDDSAGVLTIGDSNFTSNGDDSGAIIIGSAVAGPLDQTSHSIAIDNSTVSTSGDRSGGIFVNSNLNGATNADFGIQVDGVEISTLGADSHALEIIGAQNVQVGDPANLVNGRPTNGDVFSIVLIGASEDITAAGANSDAIRITNQDRTAILVNNEATVSGGTGDAFAINLMGLDADSPLALEITAQATVAKARQADRAMNLITTYINSDGMQTPSAVGGGASGSDPLTFDPVDLAGADTLVEVDNATVESMMGAGAISADGSLAVGGSNGAIIRTGEDDAAVISAVEALALLASDTTLSSMGDNAPLLNVSERAAGEGTFVLAQLTDVTATTSGGNSDALALGGGVSDSIGVLFLTASDLAAPSVVSTTGDGSRAISFDAPDRGTFTAAISRSEVSTTGADAAAILLNMGSTSSASLELLDTAVSTSGDGSDVLRLNTGSASDFTFIVADSDLISEGDDSALLRVTGREVSNVGSMVMIGGTLSSIGSNSGGIIIEGDEAAGGSAHTFFFGESSISTAGENSDGFVFERIANSPDGGGFSVGSFTLDAVDITTSGADSDAFFAGSLLAGSVRTVNLLNSSFATSGDNSRAYFAEALGGGNVTSLLISSSDFSTEGANSAAVTFNEGSVFSDIGPAASSLSALDINGSTIGTLGDNSLGIDVATLAGDQSTTVISMSDNQITTAGANSDAISIGTQAAIGREASHTISIDLSTVETSGDDSRGIYIGSLVDGLTPDDFGDQFVTDATIFIGDNVIATSGARSHGVEYATITGDLEDGIVDIVAGNSTIQTRGDNAIGILFGGVEGAFIDSAGNDARPQLSLTMAPLSIATEGDGSHGMQIGDLPAFDVADNASITLTLLTRTVTTTGDGAHGVVIGSGWGDADSDTNFNDPGSNRFAQVTVDGAIDVSGAGSHGIVSDSLINDFQISETGSITSADGFALNFASVDDGQTILNLGTIDGDVIFGDGDDLLDSEGIFTGNVDMGGGANAIFIRAGGLFNSLDSILLGVGNAITFEGDISPGGGGPFQTTAIGSDLIFGDGSRFLIDIDGMTADTGAAGFFVSDRVTVDGDITIGDATLAISSLTAEGDFDRSAQFLILDAAGTLTGEFSTIDADLPFLDLSVTYEANRAILNAGRQGPVVPFASLGLTPNQRAVGASFDTLEPNAIGDLDDVIEQLIFASTPQALTAFDTASGEIYASLLSQAGHDGLRRSRETLARARSAANSGWGIWGGLAVSDSSTDGDGNGAAVNQNDFGFDFGIDYVGEDNAWAAGVSTGWRDGNLDVPDRLSTADYDTWYLAGHVRYGSGGKGVTATAAADFAETDASVTRTLSVNAFSRTAVGNADVDSFSFAGEARYGFGAGENWAIGPVVSLIHVDSDLSLDSETGAGSVALTSADASDGRSRFGAGAFVNFQSNKAVFDLSAQYVEGASNTVGARLAFADGANAPFTVLAPVSDGSGVLTSASAGIVLGSGLSLGAQVDALFGGDVEAVNASAVLGWRF
ncbi:autotransporter outer membrane beta-barrel domain-containing protein [Pontixanthobacter aestiaquae]|uniref:Autotransporter domain-containing protein n=1 Tax=Pontixanthobacter aestiaquae TaxID=1509367 RepID=A0A844Z2A5_9SPHN|nr:autotransporter outer membrane beta-barrel domain-containing protein [Pontixanthobacter aestiaquae]MDN3647216.1 autotransporter outer membrane beta-barrel domain-containing protein [Pontixanthobacter aestiaquae]MXO81808.1 hypothetical protein [Pontixanthobacter aestiaquae]